MSPAEQRVAELVDKWLTSLELHLEYANLTEEAYWQVQPWARHQRPARWILELASTRANELKRQVQARAAAGDASFAEALELMGFLANLVGAQNIERFIPLAERERENPEALGLTHSTLQPLGSTATLAQPLSATVTQVRPQLEATREMRAPGLDAATALSGTVEMLRELEPMGTTQAVPALEHTAEMPVPSAVVAAAGPAAAAAPTVTVAPVPVSTPAPAVTAPPAPAAAPATPATPTIPVLSGAPLSLAALEARMARPTPAARRPAPAVATAPSMASATPPAAAPDAPAPATPIPTPPPVTADSAPAPKAAPNTGKSKPAPPPSRTPPRRDAKSPAGRGAPAKAGKAAAPNSIDELVVADAVRLLKWGRQWHELAEAIARMADRPGIADVRKLLRTHKATIETQAAD